MNTEIPQNAGGDGQHLYLVVGLQIAARLIEQLPAILMALAAFVAAWRAHQTASGAKSAAEAAQNRAEDVAREQVNFALRKAPLPPSLGGGPPAPQ